MKQKRPLSVTQIVFVAITFATSVNIVSLLSSFPRDNLADSEAPQVYTSSSFLVDPSFQEQYDRIDRANMTESCAKYGFEYNESMDLENTNDSRNNKGRRIFFGAMVADEEYDLIRMHAAEVYGLYDVVALVESTLTHFHTNRTLRFTRGTPGFDVVTSGVFGPHTKVYVDEFDGKTHGALYMDLEEIQRQAILQRWKEAGMQERDVAIMADIDEVLTREFLRVSKHCDIPVFRPNQNCHRPRINAFTLVFEGSPECVIALPYLWFHPDLMVGECIEYIGNPNGRPTPKRRFKDVHGGRVSGWGWDHPDDYSELVLKNGSFPLSNAADMRTGAANYAEHGSKAVVGAYHFHNFFASSAELRHKYMTYGHGDLDFGHMKLSDVQVDLDLLVRCARGLPNSANPTMDRKLIETGLNGYTGSKPIYFSRNLHRRIRHATLKQIIAQDESIHGSQYNASELTLPPIVI